ncbi:hypothetical protein B9J76_05775 [Lacticaseibacillus paracasei]|uniref:hypothetical protein n=1 Tax=Lacticaseibacillus paracasei TaxID=1597 RepID=UPI000A1FE606|nr:hypothetical protein [Lacticaseibacillus paracasei]OSP84823.1 hypothetical protein B9J76_05775 [Lacticaseibacillus paracasei]
MPPQRANHLTAPVISIASNPPTAFATKSMQASSPEFTVEINDPIINDASPISYWSLRIPDADAGLQLISEAARFTDEFRAE